MYICIENNQVISTVNYKPNVPSSVTVVKIGEGDFDNIQKGTHYFDPVSKTVKLVSQAELSKEEQRKANAVHKEFLSSTDWKVLRHIRERSLGIATTLTQEEYMDLEHQRQQAADSIVKV